RAHHRRKLCRRRRQIYDGRPGSREAKLSEVSRSYRILLVDDEIAIQRAVAPLLRSRGYDVEVAGTGRDAVSAVVDRRPDLVVLDLGLPDLDGIEVCRRIRQESKAP